MAELICSMRRSRSVDEGCSNSSLVWSDLRLAIFSLVMRNSSSKSSYFALSSMTRFRSSLYRASSAASLLLTAGRDISWLRGCQRRCHALPQDVSGCLPGEHFVHYRDDGILQNFFAECRRVFANALPILQAVEVAPHIYLFTLWLKSYFL